VVEGQRRGRQLGLPPRALSLAPMATTLHLTSFPPALFLCPKELGHTRVSCRLNPVDHICLSILCCDDAEEFSEPPAGFLMA
jgi:hypothetical protein